MIDIKRFSGVMNKDDKEVDVLPDQHIDAKNISFYGGPKGLTARNVKGNFEIANEDLPGTGTNECIGSFFDSVNRRIIFFNWNSTGLSGIYKYSIQTGLATKIFLCGTDSATDILTFNRNYPVHSAALVYRTTGDGDLLYWTDGYNRPKYINIDTVSTVAPFTDDMINAAKNAPTRPTEGTYQDDANVTANNLQKKLFRFIYRWGYKNLEKSTWSPIGKIPYPPNGYDPDTQNDPTKNNNILVPVYGGPDDYQNIELAFQVNIDDVWSDFRLVDVLDRDQYNINPGAFYFYYFYNNGSYPPVDVQSTDLYFDWLPDKANTLELLNGNVLIYGGLTDGYDKLQRDQIDVTVTVGYGNPNIPLITFAQSETNAYTIYIGETIVPGVVYNISFNYDPGATPLAIAYTTLPADTRNSVTAAIAALLTTGTLTGTNLNSGMIRVFNSGGGFTNFAASVSSSGSAVSSPCWKWNCPERLGLIYFDERGKTNGVISYVADSVDTTDFAVTTPAMRTNNHVPQIPVISASINHLPPSWAISYQWVRANLLPKRFIYWITNDYQVDNDYLYFCIQNLTYNREVNTGFVPSYEFAEGDRVRVIAAYTGGNYVPYNSQLDFEVLGTVEMTMSSPASTGTFLKVAKPTTIPAYQAAMYIEIYTPTTLAVGQKQFFYEWGERYEIYEYSAGVFYHAGQVNNQTPTQAATFEWFEGDVYYKPREMYPGVSAVATITEFTMDANYSDYFRSAVNANGRAWLIDESAREEYNQVLVRWGGKYQAGTNLNELNRFRPTDFDEADRSKGDIRRFKARDRILRVFQDRGCGQWGIYSRFIQNNEGVPELVTTNAIITVNNIQYYQGTYGLGGYPTNLCSGSLADYFVDVTTGREIRLSADGITDLGLLYKGQFYLSSLVTPYNRQVLQSNGTIAKIMKFWDSFENEAHTILQAGTDTVSNFSNYNYAFNELRNGFTGFFDYFPEWALSADDIIYSFKNGQIYKHDVSGDNYCNFYGVQYDASITVAFNPNIGQKKTWESVAELANDKWIVPLAYTDTRTYGTQRQETSLVAAELEVLEQMPSASWKRDSWSRGGKWNGDFMKGNFLAAKFQKTNASTLVNLHELICRYIDSPLNLNQ